jgi:hypothetical protein
LTARQALITPTPTPQTQTGAVTPNRREKSSLTALAREQLKVALQASSGRSAQTVYGGHEHVLRQTLIALAAGHKLDEHDRGHRRRWPHPPLTLGQHAQG